jgi:hypothetical protein
MHGKEWGEKDKDEELKKVLIDDLMSFQGSCWFTTKKHFDHIGGLDEENYGSFGKEPQEIALKTWLSGGRVVINKKTWYAHLHKGKKYGRGYPLGKSDFGKATVYLNKWLTDSAWDDRQTRPFEWLIEKFWPVPTWPNDWKQLCEEGLPKKEA